MRLIGTIALIVFCSIHVFGQSDCHSKKMIEKIDSIARIHNIQFATVSYNQVTSMFEKTSTWSSIIVEHKKFSFDGQFLVLGDWYFNIEKLLYFQIKKDYIDCYFQAY